MVRTVKEVKVVRVVMGSVDSGKMFLAPKELSTSLPYDYSQHPFLRFFMMTMMATVSMNAIIDNNYDDYDDKIDFDDYNDDYDE